MCRLGICRHWKIVTAVDLSLCESAAKGIVLRSPLGCAILIYPNSTSTLHSELNKQVELVPGHVNLLCSPVEETLLCENCERQSLRS